VLERRDRMLARMLVVRHIEKEECIEEVEHRLEEEERTEEVFQTLVVHILENEVCRKG
jgi:hypothetical protein